MKSNAKPLRDIWLGFNHRLLNNLHPVAEIVQRRAAAGRDSQDDIVNTRVSDAPQHMPTVVAVCAGDGTYGSQLLCSHATDNHTPLILPRSLVLGKADSTPACAYLAGTPALILSQAYRANSP